MAIRYDTSRSSCGSLSKCEVGDCRQLFSTTRCLGEFRSFCHSRSYGKTDNVTSSDDAGHQHRTRGVAPERPLLLRLEGAPGIMRFAHLVPSLALLVAWPGLQARGQTQHRPLTLLVIHQPSGKMASDSLLAAQPVVRVMDDSGHPVRGIEVLARICSVGDLSSERIRARAAEGNPSPRCIADVTGLVSLRGNVLVQSDSVGDATFKDLTFAGPSGKYRLTFATLHSAQESGDPSGGEQRPRSCGDTSDIMVYDAERASDRSYVAVSAIKSIAGIIPNDEFFEIRGRFRYGPRLFGMASIDVALSNRGSDTVRSTQQALTEAAVSLNYAVSSVGTRRTAITDEYDRTLFVGGVVRVFNTLPYLGAQVGSVENATSAFHGSTFIVGVLHDLSLAPSIVQGDTLVPAQWALFSEFFLRSSTIDFFKTLNLRGAVLLPVFKQKEKLQSRITVSVPVGTLNLF